MASHTVIPDTISAHDESNDTIAMNTPEENHGLPSGKAKRPQLSHYSSNSTTSTATESTARPSIWSHGNSFTASSVGGSPPPLSPEWTSESRDYLQVPRQKAPLRHLDADEDSQVANDNLEPPAPVRLEPPKKPTIQLKVRDPRRELQGVSKPPRSNEIDDQDEEEDFGIQQAVAVQALPGLPSDPIERSANTQSKQGAAPLLFPTTQIKAEVRQVDVDGTLRKYGRRKILFGKHTMQATLLGLNGLCIFATWWWMRYYYILLPFITATVALNVAMVVSLVIRKTWNTFRPEKKYVPDEPESMVFLVPCYNETKEELIRSLDSLVSQRNIENHKQAIMVVCDGKVRGPGMEKTTADYLLQDILVHKTSREYVTGAYTAWDQQPMDCVVQRGVYQGTPYMCIIKQQNQGKRDGLILVRSFLYNFNRRHQSPLTIFSPHFFDKMANFLIEDGQMQSVVHLVGMDADTVFDENCISELLEESRYAHTVGVCGYVAVDWKDSYWNAWRLYQSAEYTIAQCLRRLHQSMVTHKVSCLPGCCQLLKVCEETCGDHVLLQRFGYCPKLTDGILKQIRATASEDRNHVCHMLSERPKTQTRQALRAKAYTDVPGSWSVFLSQRRRWTLGATSNDLLLVTAPGVQWFERIIAAVNCSTWFLNPFIFASVASFIFAMVVVPVWIVMCFVSVMLIPIAYYLIIPLWLCKQWKERVQFWAGCFLYIFCGPFINISVLIYALIYMDSFGWGKTRKVVSDSSSEGTMSELERIEAGEKVAGAAQPLATNAVVMQRDVGQEEKSLGWDRP